MMLYSSILRPSAIQYNVFIELNLVLNVVTCHVTRPDSGVKQDACAGGLPISFKNSVHAGYIEQIYLIIIVS